MAERLQQDGPGAFGPPRNGTALTEVVHDLNVQELMLERGTSGLKRAGGYLREEFLPQLSGQQGVRIYREMRDNSPVIGGCLFAIEMLIRHVTWRLVPAKSTPEAQHYAALARGMLFDDLEMPWDLLLSEILSFLPFGFSYFEMVFKRRQGRHPPVLPDGTPQLPSQFDDGHMGLAKIAPRAQDTVLRWEFDPTGGLRGMHQLDPWTGRHCYLPYEKCLLFRPTSYKNSPEGRSVLRTAYRSYYMLSHAENTQLIGVERNLNGLPMIGTPGEWWSATASMEDQARLAMAKTIGRNIRMDEQACVVYPLLYDQNNNKLFTFELASSSGQAAMQTTPILERYELRMTQSLLSDLLFLGHDAVGSGAVASTKTTTQAMSLGGYLTVITDEINRRCLPLLWELNAWPDDLMPALAHGDVESVDLTELSRFVLSYARVFNMQDLENHIRGLAGLPERPDAENHPLPPSILPTSGGEGFHSHGGGSGTGIEATSTVPGAGVPDLDRELAPPSL